MSALVEEADIVIVGGGVIGASVAYHLGQRGAGKIILLERKKLTSGTTWHSAGQVRQLRSTRNMTEVIGHSIDLYSRLEEETGQSTGWTQSGSLSIATNEDRLTHIRRQAGLAKAHGVNVHEIGPDEISKLWPLLNVSDVIAGIHCPTDGRVNPSDVTAAMIKGAKANGLRVFEDCPVTGFEVEKGRVTAVETAQGRVRCGAVVLSAGLWSREIGAMAGLSVPVYATEHFYLLTKPIEGIDGALPTLGDHDAHLYIRDEVGGLLVGCFEPDGKPVDPSDLPKDFEFDLLDEDWDHFEPMMHNALHRIPVLETAEARMLLNGPESFTPDGHPIVGQSPEIANFYLACGLNSAGVASAGGVGKVLADWIVEGEATMDLLEIDPCRFHLAQNKLPELGPRAAEAMVLHYAISYPGREHATARGLATTPLHDRLKDRGAIFGERFGTERALYFTEPGMTHGPLTYGRPAWHERVGDECRAAREAVALFDDSLFGKIRVEGGDAEALLDRLCMGDMTRAPGRAVYTCLLNARGGIESDLTVLREDETSFLLYTNATSRYRDLARIRRHIDEGMDVTASDVTDDIAVIAVVGPKSTDLLSDLSDDDFSPKGFPYFTHRPATVADHYLRAARISYAGELGWELSILADQAGTLYDALLEGGEAHGILPGGAYAMNSLRTEKAYASFGHEIGPDTSPVDVGLDKLAKLGSDRDFIGRAALEKARDDGAKHALMTLVLEDEDMFPIADEPVYDGDAMVGQVTSAAFGHSIGKPVALARIALGDGGDVWDFEGRELAIDVGGRRAIAYGNISCAFDPDGQRLRGLYSASDTGSEVFT